MRFVPALIALTTVAVPVASAPRPHRLNPTVQRPPLTPHDSALHALERLAYGPRPGDVDRVAASGVMAWIDAQLHPERIADRSTDFRGLFGEICARHLR